MGSDKASLVFGDEPLLARTVRVASAVVDVRRIVVAAGTRQSLPPLPSGVRVVRDRAPGQGPLPALAAGLQSLVGIAGAALVVACDAPLLEPALVAWMFDRLQSARAAAPARPPDAVVPADAERLYPLTAVYQVEPCAAGLAAAAADARGSLHAALRSGRLEVLRIPVDELRAADPRLLSLVNCNTPEECAAALAAARPRSP